MNNPNVYLPQDFHRYPTTVDEGNTYTYDKIKAAENVLRKDKIWYPENTGTFSTNGNKLIRIECPDLGCYDFQRSVIYLTVSIAQTPALVNPYVALPNGIWNIFSRARHLDGSAPVEDRNDANLIASWWWFYRQDPFLAQTIGSDLLGVNLLLAERVAKALAPTRYALPFPLKFLCSGIMPLRKFLKQYVELYMADPNSYLETNGTDNVVTISDVQWHFAQIEGKQFTDALEADVDAGRFQVAIDGFQLFQNANLTINNNLVISHRAKSLKGVFTKFRQGNDLNNTQTPYQKFWTFPKLDCVDFQYRILGDLWPELPVDCRVNGERNYVDYLKWVNVWYADGLAKQIAMYPNVSISEFNTNGFMVMGDFTNDPHIIERPHVINNISTSKMAQDLQLNVRFENPPPPGFVADHIIHYTIMVQCGTKVPMKIDF